MQRKYQLDYDIAPPITFGNAHITLDIPEDGAETKNGWRIVPQYIPVVSNCWTNLSKEVIASIVLTFVGVLLLRLRRTESTISLQNRVGCLSVYCY